MTNRMISSQLESMRIRINEHRKSIEQVRSFNVRRLQNDIKRMSKQEIEFTKGLLEEIIPVKVVWNEDATKKIKEMMPFTIEITASKNTTDESDETKPNNEIKNEKTMLD